MENISRMTRRHRGIQIHRTLNFGPPPAPIPPAPTQAQTESAAAASANRSPPVVNSSPVAGPSTHTDTPDAHSEAQAGPSQPRVRGHGWPSEQSLVEDLQTHFGLPVGVEEPQAVVEEQEERPELPSSPERVPGQNGLYDENGRSYQGSSWAFHF